MRKSYRYGRKPDKNYTLASRIPMRYKVAAVALGTVCALIAGGIVSLAFDRYEALFSKKRPGFSAVRSELTGGERPVIALHGSTYAPVAVAAPSSHGVIQAPTQQIRLTT